MFHQNKEFCHHLQQFVGFRKDNKFALPGAPKQYPPPLEFKAKHYHLDLKVDLEAKQIKGSATITLESFSGKQNRLKLDAIELNVEKVLFEGQVVPFRVFDTFLEIVLPSAPAIATPFSVQIFYSAQPRKGLYFQTPDVDHADLGLQVWSQGQDIDSKWWFPCLDYPNQKATSEMRATVAERYFCLSNGQLLETLQNTDGTKTYHWKQSVPHVNYLVTLVVGEFEFAEEHWNGIPIQYYVPKNAKEKIARVFGKTPEMMKYFSEKIGIPYPYEKYAQVVAQNFVFGGMENTTATTLSDRILVDERAAVDYDWVSLVAHELAHQWWGNLVTCRGWAHAWLNEGFATFFEIVYFECADGLEEADNYAYGLRADYYSELKNYSRKLVESEFFDCGELFDRHIYHKGALVLRMLRHFIGEDMWWKGVKAYVERHAKGFAETDQFRLILEETTGQQLGRFFDDWVYGERHPQITAKYTFDEKNNLLALTLTQTQKHQIFSIPLQVDVVVQGKEYPFVAWCNQAEQHFFFPVPAHPERVVLNRRGMILCDLELEFPESALINQLQEDSDSMARVFAAQQLGKSASPKRITALRQVLLAENTFWGVQAACAEALGELKCHDAMQVLIEARQIKHPKARLEVVKALGAYPFKEAFESLKPILAQDSSYFVEAEAALAIGKTRHEDALKHLMDVLKTKAPSFNFVIQINLLAGIAELKKEESLDVLKSYLAPQHPMKMRLGALGGLTQLFLHFKEKRDWKLFETLYHNAGFHLRYKITQCLQTLSDPASLKLLEHIRENELDGRIRRCARETIATIRESEGKDFSKFSQELEALRDENKKVVARLATLEAKQNPSTST